MEKQQYVHTVIGGCTHGGFDQSYQAIKLLEEEHNVKMDLFISCGDFQAVRNMEDLENISCPAGDFYKYYAGITAVPVPTIFIGGNHEASQHLLELYFGGWAAPNVYFLGHSGCINFSGLRIAGISGIEKMYDYSKGYYERIPLSENHKRSIYHIRKYEVEKVCHLTDIDIFLSHDWPRNVWKFDKEVKTNVKKKNIVRAIESKKMGSQKLEMVLKRVQPRYWCSAHFHVNYECSYPHSSKNLSDSRTTQFMASNKPNKEEEFVKYVKIPLRQPVPPEQMGKFYYDPEWLAILKLSHQYFSLGKKSKRLPNYQKFEYEQEKLKVKFSQKEIDLSVPDNFKANVKPYDHTKGDGRYVKGVLPRKSLENEQRKQFLKFLGEKYDPIDVLECLK